MRLANKVASITGGTGGMGNASARLFAQEGAAVLIAAWDKAVVTIRESYGALHVLMNVVGSNDLVMFPEIDIEP